MNLKNEIEVFAKIKEVFRRGAKEGQFSLYRNTNGDMQITLTCARTIGHFL
jgi:hypothetical protein